jgi:hypothetical protein
MNIIDLEAMRTDTDYEDRAVLDVRDDGDYWSIHMDSGVTFGLDKSHGVTPKTGEALEHRMPTPPRRVLAPLRCGFGSPGGNESTLGREDDEPRCTKPSVHRLILLNGSWPLCDEHLTVIANRATDAGHRFTTTEEPTTLD